MDELMFGFTMGAPFLVGTLVLGFVALISGKLQKDK